MHGANACSAALAAFVVCTVITGATAHYLRPWHAPRVRTFDGESESGFTLTTRRRLLPAAVQVAQHHKYKCQACCACVFFTVTDKDTINDFGNNKQGQPDASALECRVGQCDFFKGSMYNPKFNNLQPRYCWDTAHNDEKNKWGSRCFMSDDAVPPLCQSNTKFKVCPFMGTVKQRQEDCKRDGKVRKVDCR